MDRIGPYHLVRALGEGGMGIVYEARQEEPVKRTVALKVIKAGMDTKQVVARFEAERQALALMNHPGIAKVLDSGETSEGRPYFVMELVEGFPLDTYLRRNKLSLEERLQLFMAIGRAVAHAHQKGIIHRDLKPSNIIVQETDGIPQPRIIDFGIAKAVGGAGLLTEKTLLTSYSQVLGTPAYMSPEQLDISGEDLDTRTDIYALGVILYQILTGTLPFDSKRLARASLSELEMILCEEDPPRPSKRAEDDSLKGDLDWIVMKALEKDPAKRYESAGAFVADIERYLKHEAVSAVAPSAGYVLGKFARRNRFALVFGISIFLLLAIGTVISTYLAIQAQRQANRAEETLAFLRDDLLRVGDPYLAGHNLDTSLGEVMDRAQSELEGRFEDQPEIRLDLLLTILRVYVMVGEFQKVLSVCDQSLPLVDALDLHEHEEDFYIRYQRGYAFFKMRRYDDALAVLAPLAPRAQEVLGRESNTAHLATIFLARTHTFLRNYDEAERLNREYLTYLESIGKGSERQAILANDGIASNYMNSGRPAQAQPYYERVIELMVAMGRESGPYFVTVQANLGASFANQGQFEKARPILEAAFERRLELFGPNAYDVMNHRHDMAGLYWELGEHDKAIATAKQAWEDRSSNLGDHARETLESWHRYAEMLVNAGFEEEGLAEAPKLLPYAHKVFGDSHAITNWCVEHAPSREAAIGMVATMQNLESWEAERVLTLLPRGSDWHYHDLEDAPPDDWHQLAFDPASWPRGSAPLGYGESDIAQEISFGSNPDAKRASAYFRTTFRYAGDELEKLRLRVRRDDGVILWLNGVEVARHHLPPEDQSEGDVFAQREVGGIEERLYYCIDLNPDALQFNNVITAAVHQCNGRSSDLVFDLSVEGLRASSSVGD